MGCLGQCCTEIRYECGRVSARKWPRGLTSLRRCNLESILSLKIDADALVEILDALPTVCRTKDLGRVFLPGPEGSQYYVQLISLVTGTCNSWSLCPGPSHMVVTIYGSPHRTFSSWAGSHCFNTGAFTCLIYTEVLKRKKLLP